MKKPGGMRGFVGTPIVTFAILAAGAYCLYIWYLNPDAAVLGIGALVAMGWAIEANRKVAQYAAWKRAWDSMAPGRAQPQTRKPSNHRTALQALAGLGAVAYICANPSDPASGLGAIVLVVGTVTALARRWKARGASANQNRSAAQVATVSVCVRGPLMGVPSLKGAYDALPQHCWVVLKAR